VIYVSNFRAASVTVFRPTARDNAAPVRTIAGARTGLSGPLGLAIDAQDLLYVANRTGAGVTVHGPTAHGDVAPVRTLRVPASAEALAVAVGPDGDVFVATVPRAGAAGCPPAIVHFRTRATESDYAIAGPLTGLTCPVGLAFHPGGQLYVANALGGVVSAFAADAIGNASPLQSFTAATSSTRAIACGAGMLLLTGPGVYLYPSAGTPANGPAAAFGPSSSFSLRYASGIAIDAHTQPPIVYVADYTAGAVHVIETVGVPPYLAVAKASAIKGPATRLDGPVGVLCAP
jgi:DNA-binding beta-propeller fold protein YncE